MPVCFVIPSGQLNAQKQQLEQEIGERKAIEADLRATQDELIQTAKLAVVGQTMTTPAHEINQPLNALSMYLFTAGRAIEQGQAEQARMTLSKAEGLINRIDAIIRSLRQFTRRAELETPLHPVDLRQTFTVAWELLAMRHKPQQGTLVIPDDTVWIQGGRSARPSGAGERAVQCPRRLPARRANHRELANPGRKAVRVDCR